MDKKTRKQFEELLSNLDKNQFNALSYGIGLGDFDRIPKKRFSTDLEKIPIKVIDEFDFVIPAQNIALRKPQKSYDQINIKENLKEPQKIKQKTKNIPKQHYFWNRVSRFVTLNILDIIFVLSMCIGALFLLFCLKYNLRTDSFIKWSLPFVKTLFENFSFNGILILFAGVFLIYRIICKSMSSKSFGLLMIDIFLPKNESE